jgi:hypothetical protein
MNRGSLGPVLVLFAIYTGLHITPLFPGHALAAWMGALAFFALSVSWLFLYRAGASPEARWFQIFSWVSSATLGIWATFVLLSLFLDLTKLALLLASPALFERLPSSRALTGGCLAVSVFLALLGLAQALSGPRVIEVKVKTGEGAKALRGLRIVQISDLHIGPLIQTRYVEDVIGRVLELKPDLIAITGDLADGSVKALTKQMQPLMRLKAPLGVYFVTGNHEYYWDGQGWIAKTRELGLTPLVNEGRVVQARGVDILVAGVCDSQAHLFVPAHKSDASKAASGGERCAFKILLAHRPDAGASAERAGFDLQLSGHTHGGQFFPFSLLIGLVHRHSRGLRRLGKLQIYVNTGTGYWGPPHRLAKPAEITLLQLT